MGSKTQRLQWSAGDGAGMGGDVLFADIKIAQRRSENDTQCWPARLDQRDVDGELIPPVDEFAGAIQRIHQEEAAARCGRPAACCCFLGDHRQIRCSSRKPVDNDGFGGKIGFRNGRAILLRRGTGAMADLQDHIACDESEPDKRQRERAEGQVRIDGHSRPRSARASSARLRWRGSMADRTAAIAAASTAASSVKPMKGSISAMPSSGITK